MEARTLPCVRRETASTGKTNPYALQPPNRECTICECKDRQRQSACVGHHLVLRDQQRMLKRIVVAVGLIAFSALSIMRVAVAPDAVPATAPDSTFSAERAMIHVRQIAERPHPMGSTDHDRVRDYVVSQLVALGLEPQVQQTTAIGTRYQAAGRVQNIVARLPGRQPGGKAVLMMVHYDGVEAAPAAGDDAAGSAALLETLRALRASKQLLLHDVIALFTDGEESGLLGAAAFVREHAWAKDIGVALNFEARGTTGRSLMFETGPGNLDVARALRQASDATACSVYATIYRTLPNDTDLSELAVLGVPALNFAFADGVERYHTSNDNVAFLNPGSVQHHGSYMLDMVRVFGNEPLPRATTGDGVFFDLPVLGLIVYSQAFEIPLAIIALLLVAALVVRDRRGVLTGALTALAAVVLSAVVGFIAGKFVTGPAVWSGRYALAIALFALSATIACSAFARRWTTSHRLHVGALCVLALLALTVAVRAPGVGYLFTWPLIFAAIASLLTNGREPAGYVSAGVTLLILAGFVYGVAVIMLGLAGVGAIALCVVVTLIGLFVMPQLETIGGTSKLLGAGWIAGAGVLCVVFAALTVHPSAAHPIRTALVYAQNADSTDAWLGSLGASSDAWTRSVLGSAELLAAPAWTARLSDRAGGFVGRKVERVALEAPNATLLSDSVADGNRHVVLRVNAPRGSIAVTMRASGATVVASSIDGQVVSTARYRNQSRDWIMAYWAVPDSGATVALTVAAGQPIQFAVAVRRPGIPALAGVTIPARPDDTVPSQTGDISVVYRQWRF